MTSDKITILDRGAKWLERGIKETIHIRVENATLNRERVPHIWDTLLARHLRRPPHPLVASSNNSLVAVNRIPGEVESLVVLLQGCADTEAEL